MTSYGNSPKQIVRLLLYFFLEVLPVKRKRREVVAVGFYRDYGKTKPITRIADPANPNRMFCLFRI